MRIAIALVAAATVAILTGCSPASNPTPASTPTLPGHLVWGQEQSDGFVLFTANTDGSGVNPVGGAEHGDSPHWSPDGTKLAIVISDPTGNVVGSVANPDGSDQVVFGLEPGQPNLACASWSPDGMHLACEGFSDANPDLHGVYVVSSADGSGAERLTQESDSVCAYSPDGTEIAILRHDGPDEEHSTLMAVAVDGDHAIRTITTERVGLGCDWSSDGATILGELNGTLRFIDVATGELTVVDIPGISTRGAYSPDGTHIVFSRVVGTGQEDLWTARLDGSDRVEITHTPDANEEFGDWGI